MTEFDGKLLKTLFLIRYVDVLKSTLDNLVTLSIERIDTDKVELRRQIEASLNRLQAEMLISRIDDKFVFLTNEEKRLKTKSAILMLNSPPSISSFQPSFSTRS